MNKKKNLFNFFKNNEYEREIDKSLDEFNISVIDDKIQKSESSFTLLPSKKIDIGCRVMIQRSSEPSISHYNNYKGYIGIVKILKNDSVWIELESIRKQLQFPKKNIICIQ
jgi:transcription elongation factor